MGQEILRTKSEAASTFEWHGPARSCIDKFEEDGFAEASGLPGASAVGLSEQATFCETAKGGTYVFFKTNLPRRSEHVAHAWPRLGAQASQVVNTLTDLLAPISDDQWRQLDCFSLCLPPVAACQNHEDAGK